MIVKPVELTINIIETLFEVQEVKVLASEYKESQELCDEQS